MNLEHVLKTIFLNKNRLKSQKKARHFLIYHYEALDLKKSKLKLGSVTFDIVYTLFEGFPIKETLEMRYTRQDTTAEDELKVETRLEALKWKWDYSNILAFLIIFIFFIIFLIALAYVWYWNNLPDFAFKNPKYDLLVNRSLKLIFLSTNIKAFNLLLISNYFLVDSLIHLCSFFNVFF